MSVNRYGDMLHRLAGVAPSTTGQVMVWDGNLWRPGSLINATLALADHTFAATSAKEQWGSTASPGIPAGVTGPVNVFASINGSPLPPGGTAGQTFRADIQISLDGGGTFTTSKESLASTNVGQGISFNNLAQTFGLNGTPSAGGVQIKVRCQLDAGTAASNKVINGQLTYVITPG